MGAKEGAWGRERLLSAAVSTRHSPFDFNETHSRVLEAINSQSDTIIFGSVDFQSQVQEFGVDIRPTQLILFGGPSPGAKAMRNAPTLGLDAFCQKLLVWEDDQQMVHLGFNDLLRVAERQDVGKSIPLRVIAFRLKRIFTKALSD